MYNTHTHAHTNKHTFDCRSHTYSISFKQQRNPLPDRSSANTHHLRKSNWLKGVRASCCFLFLRQQFDETFCFEKKISIQINLRWIQRQRLSLSPKPDFGSVKRNSWRCFVWPDRVQQQQVEISGSTSHLRATPNGLTYSGEKLFQLFSS